MNRRKALKALIGAGFSAPILNQAAGQVPAVVQRSSAINQTGKPKLSTVEAVKQISTARVKEILPEVAEYYQHYGANFAPTGEWTADQAANYTRFIQRSLREPETAKLTLEQAARILTRKRCGRPDPSPAMIQTESGRLRYTAPTWWVDPNMKTNLTVEQWQNVLQSAWASWQAVSVLTPKPSSNASGANCIHASGVGRTDGFDGPGGVLAWAELPPTSLFTGQLLNRYDAGESWTMGTDERSIRALNVAAHEIGHLLGLEHSSDPSALMAPFYDPDVPKPVQNDIDRIRRLYPVASLPPGTPTPPVDPPNPPVPPIDPPAPPVDPGPPDGGPCGRRPRWFPPLPRLFPRRRGTC